jgi:hypothetical protein
MSSWQKIKSVFNWLKCILKSRVETTFIAGSLRLIDKKMPTKK